MLNEILNTLCNFISIERSLFDNVASFIIYAIYIYLAVKNGAGWITLLIGYLFISIVLSFMGLSSYFNIIELTFELLRTMIIEITKLIGDFLKNVINPFD